MSRCSCGHDLAETNRYCPQCGAKAPTTLNGAPPDSKDSGSPGPSGPETVLLSETSQSETAHSSSELRSGTSLRWLATGGVAVVALLWALFAWPQSDEPVDGGGPDNELAAEEDDDEPGSATTTTVVTTVTTDPESDDEDTDSDSDGDEGRTTEAGSGTTSTTVETLGVRPLLGEETGLGILIGGSGFSAAIRLIDLDRGELRKLPVDGAPLAVVDSTLVFGGGSGAVFVWDMAAPESEPIMLGQREPGGWTNYAGFEDGIVWVIGDTRDGQTVTGYSLSGEEVQRLDLGDFLFLGWTGRLSLVYHPAGGIYERDGDRFTKVDRGFLQALGDEVALVQNCDDQLVCRSTFRDRDTWDRLDYPEPDNGASPFGGLSLAGSDRWLVQTDWRAGTLKVSDVKSGRVVKETSNIMNGPFSVTPISDDGRWMMDFASPRTVVNLETGEEWPLEVVSSGEDSAVFIEMADTAYRP